MTELNERIDIPDSWPADAKKAVVAQWDRANAISSRLDTLTAENAKLRHAFDDLAAMPHSVIPKLEAQIKEQGCRLDKLLEFARTFSQHSNLCEVSLCTDDEKPECSCGYLAGYKEMIVEKQSL